MAPPPAPHPKGWDRSKVGKVGPENSPLADAPLSDHDDSTDDIQQ